MDSPSGRPILVAQTALVLQKIGFLLWLFGWFPGVDKFWDPGTTYSDAYPMGKIFSPSYFPHNFSLLNAFQNQIFTPEKILECVEEGEIINYGRYFALLLVMRQILNSKLDFLDPLRPTVEKMSIFHILLKNQKQEWGRYKLRCRCRYTLDRKNVEIFNAIFAFSPSGGDKNRSKSLSLAPDHHRERNQTNILNWS